MCLSMKKGTNRNYKLSNPQMEGDPKKGTTPSVLEVPICNELEGSKTNEKSALKPVFSFEPSVNLPVFNRITHLLFVASQPLRVLAHSCEAELADAVVRWSLKALV